MTVRLEELLANATPGPWNASGHAVSYLPKHQPVASCIYPHNGGNAALIALAPDAVRLLIDMGEALRRRCLIDYEDGLWRTAAIPEEQARALLARLDRLGNTT